MKTIALFLLFLCSVGIYAQKSDSSPQLKGVEINTKFKLKLIQTNRGYDFQIVDREPYDKKLDLKKIKNQSLFSASQSDEIQCIFTYAKLGENMSAFLVLQSGLENPLKYNLFIKPSFEQDMEEVSVLNLFPDTPSTEVWPFNVDYIVFSEFQDAVK